ncbi:MAG: hypothetical protein WBG90_00315 [Saonia sp.]
MKLSILKWYTLTAVLLFFTACSDDDTDPIIDEDPVADLTFKDMESDWVRLTLMREDGLDVMQADSGEITYSVDGPLIEGARYYTSNSGRYLTVVERDGGKVRFFDSGIVNHDDHGHEYPAKWANAELNTVLPTHYAGSGGHIVIFNDGDGSISYINEAQLEIPSYQPETFVLENTVPHHGAGFRLGNGMFAATFKNTDEPGGIPQMVKFIQSDGTIIDDNGGVEVVGIHGDAVNGSYGVFGSTDGVILVDDQNNIDLISNTEGLNSESGNWLGTLKGHDNSGLFFARSRNLGVFMVDPVAKTLESIYLGGDVVGDMFSFDGAYYLVHTSDNKVRVFDSQTGTEVAERTVEMADIPQLASKKGASEMETLKDMEEPSPVLVCSDKYLYVLAPNRTQIKVLKIDGLEHVHTIELDTPVESMMKNGFSIEGDQNLDYEH